MEQICLTSLMDINHGLIIFPTWSKMAHGVIMWFSMGLQTAIKHTLTWLAVSQITVTLLSGLMVMWSAPTHLCWAMFMKSTMSACSPNKVRLYATHCVIRQFVGNVYHFTRESLVHHTVHITCKSVIYSISYISPWYVNHSFFRDLYFCCDCKEICLVGM